MTKRDQKSLFMGLGFMALAFGTFWVFRKKVEVPILLPTQVKFES